MNKKPIEIALEIIKTKELEEENIKACRKAGICLICGEPLQAKFIKHGEFMYDDDVCYGFLGLKKKTIPIYQDIVKIYCKKDGDICETSSCNWNEYANTINSDIQKELSKLTYHDEY